MKFAIMIGATLLGIALGFMPRLSLPRPAWWKIISILSVTATIVFGLMPPIAGTMVDATMAGRADPNAVVPVLITVGAPDNTGRVIVTDARRSQLRASMVGDIRQIEILSRLSGKTVIADVKLADSDTEYELVKVGEIDPLITLPYILGLEERARIIFFHVPMSWVATVAYLLSMIFAIRYLVTRDEDFDTYSMATASVGTLYAVLATVTGAVWAKFNWGSFWNWDPRETSIFLLLLVYAAYFLLRGSIDDPERKARISSAYSIVAFVTVPFLVFVLPRLVPGLHPGSADDVNAGPLLSAKSDAINTTKQIVFGLSLFAFTTVFFWLVSLKVRVTRMLNSSLEELK